MFDLDPDEKGQDMGRVLEFGSGVLSLALEEREKAMIMF